MKIVIVKEDETGHTVDLNLKVIKMKVVAVSGGFDPIHIGHVRMFQEASSLGTKLVVILNNDNWLMKKKGYVFMPQEERKYILERLYDVDEVVLTKHKIDDPDTSVSRELRKIKPDIFANGGDRNQGNIPEKEVCDRLDIKMIDGLGAKIRASSELLKNIKNDN